MENIINDLENELDNINEKYPLTPENLIDEKNVLQSLTVITTKLSLLSDAKSTTHCLLGIIGLFQSGAYLAKVENRKITIRGITFSKGELLIAISQAQKTKGFELFTLRTYARTIKKLIAKTAIKYNLPGHLFAQFKLDNPNYNIYENPEETTKIAAYCTDFQYDNPDTPQIVKDFLSNRSKLRKIK